MTPVQLQTLITVHNIFNEPDEKKRSELMDGRTNPSHDAVHVNAEHTEAIIHMLASQKLSKRK